MELKHMIKYRIARFLLSATVLAAATQSVHAQSGISSPEDRPMPTKQFVLDLGGGAMVKSKYPGADSYLFYPFPIIAVGRFYGH